jgi:hypothetical protein
MTPESDKPALARFFTRSTPGMPSRFATTQLVDRHTGQVLGTYQFPSEANFARRLCELRTEIERIDEELRAQRKPHHD